MKLLKTSIIVAHRYLGIALSLFVIMWFVSGIVMMYGGGMPRLAPQLRLERLPALDLSRVRLTPAQAAETAGSGRVQLVSVMGRPAYRGGDTTVFADTGEVLEKVSLKDAQTIVANFMRVPASQVHFERTITSIDQWTLLQSRSMPLHKFRVDDEAGTELYLQPASGEIVMLTTRKARLLAWTGTIPHWLYFTALRENQPLWYRIVVWTSAAALGVALLGMVLSVTQLRRVRPFSLAKAIPYSGFMRWHYVTGAIFGFFTVTWAFSGMLSMEPFAWTNAPALAVKRDVFTGGPADLSKFAALDAPTWQRVLGGRAIKEMEFVRIQDEHYYAVRQAAADPAAEERRERLHQPYNVTGRTEPDRVLVNAETLEVRREPFSQASLVARLERALPDVPIVESEILTDYDSYYYSRARQTPLPVLRVKFADPAETWFYVDPETSQMLSQIPRLARIERWFYNGLHSLDFAFWYNRRPLWDIGMLTLLLGGLTSTCLGLVMGVRRMRRGAARVTKSWAPSPVPPVRQPQGAMSSAVSESQRA
jgi:hypothetical protein